MNYSRSSRKAWGRTTANYMRYMVTPTQNGIAQQQGKQLNRLAQLGILGFFPVSSCWGMSLSPEN